jgi:hypothetical protein
VEVKKETWLHKFTERVSPMRISLPEGLLLGVITGLGYFSAYLSEVGYKAYFHLPSMYADISVNTLILSVSIIVLICLLGILSLQVPWIHQYGRFVFPLLIPLSLWFVTSVKMGFFFDWEHPYKWWGLCLFNVAAIGVLFECLHRRRLLAGALVLVVLVVITARISGELVAENQQWYLVAKRPQPVVVVDTYKDALIVAPINLQKRTIQPRYQLIDSKGEPDRALSFQPMRVGPLRVENR